MKKRNKFNKRFTIIITILVIIISLVLLQSQNSRLIPITSKELDLHILVPTHYDVTQKFHTIRITNQNGEIIVSTYGSFYKNLDAHLNYLSKKNNVKIDIIEKYNNNFYKVRFNHSYGQRPEDISYIVLNGYTIHTFEANSEELYTDLDAIAKSFRYNP